MIGIDVRVCLATDCPHLGKYFHCEFVSAKCKEYRVWGNSQLVEHCPVPEECPNKAIQIVSSPYENFCKKNIDCPLKGL